jgi:UDP-2,3-diacylglucosamine pyrophosphatase LpxH
VALFVSDLHLGSRACKGADLLEFLADNRHHEELYLVGDVVDDYQVARWPDSHVGALLAIMRWPVVHYLPGNHDRWLRAYLGLFANVTIANELVVDKTIRWVNGLGPLAGLARRLAPGIERAHTRRGGSDGAFADRVTRYAADRGLDGVICGHSHHPVVAKVNEVEYINCGDWVESRTGVSEEDGKITLVTRRKTT